MKKVLLATAVFMALGSSSVMVVVLILKVWSALKPVKKSSAPLLVIAISTVRLL
ncbi:hypothetical protein ACVVKG_002936 [Salmonella enterica subsp. enterica serovar Cerro]|uniref:hypothetical protein n=1 Tax=Salmonella enterica TaxID=28901 RepID=UPI0003BDC5A0|nr:hypothetical protein [Salmonella enterica]ESG99566.1 hypothetical protein SEEJ0720_07580 [Salmonella enterica subsp. enterica serovar Javiana str. PRS_2010_0720]